MSNSFVCVGNLGDNANMEMAGSTPVLKFSVANNVGWGDRKTVMWIGCALFGTRGEKLQQYLLKGAKVMVRGELTTNTSGQGKTFLNLNVDDVDVVVHANQDGPQGQGGYQQPAQQNGYQQQTQPQGQQPQAQQPQAPAPAPQGGYQQQGQQPAPAPQGGYQQQGQQPAPAAPQQGQQGNTPFDQMFT